MPAKTYPPLKFKGYREAKGLSYSAGIYCVYACTYNQRGNTVSVSIRKLLYIGEAEDIHMRVKKHERREDWEKKLKHNEDLCFSYALKSNDEDRERIEAALINKHKPPCNDEFTENFPYDKTTIKITGKISKLQLNFTVNKS